MKNFSLTVTVMLSVVLTPGHLIAASEVVIGYANISARVSPLWIAQEKGFFAKFGVNGGIKLSVRGAKQILAALLGTWKVLATCSV
jgi:ABC-type nitrate/sulfonate/bicarbonate transport system substrate-binding protein